MKRNFCKLLILEVPGSANLAYDGATPYEMAGQAINNTSGNMPEPVLMYIDLHGITSLEAAARLKERTQLVNLLMNAVFRDESIFHSLLEGIGAHFADGLAMKKIPAARHSGRRPANKANARIAAGIDGQLSQEAILAQAGLTSKEMEVLQLLSDGLLCKEVAHRLHRSTQTIRNHCANIYGKLNVNTRTKAINIVFGRRD